MASSVYRYPLDKSSKNRTWIRFKQVDFELNEDNVIKVKGSNTDAVYLYLGGALQFNDQIAYNTDAELGFAGTAIEAAIRNKAFGGLSKADAGKRAAGALNFAGTAYKDAIGLVGDTLSGKKINGALITKVLERTKFDNTDLGRGIKASLKYTANPHKRALFESVGIRSFDFDFTMIPTSSDEAEEIERIVKFFRRIAYPSHETHVPVDGESPETSVAANLANSLVYKFPSMLKVDMFYQLSDDSLSILNSNPDIEEELHAQYGINDIDKNNGMIRIGPKLKYCYISGVGMVLDPESTMSWHADGQAVGTNLTLSITEDSTLSRTDIEQGF